MGIFDNYGSESTDTNHDVTNDTNNVSNESLHETSNLFSVFDDVPNTSSDDVKPVDNTSSDIPSSDEVIKPSEETVKPVETTSEENVENPSKEQLTYKDLDDYFKKQKKYDEDIKELTRYKEEEAKNNAAKQAEIDKSNEMPDPVYHPNEYREWNEKRLKEINESYEKRFNQYENKIMVDNITSRLETTYNTTVEKHGKDVVESAEKWAADIINKAPKEALDILKNNPSWEFIVSEYKKNLMETKIKNDPEAYINAEVEKRLNEIKTNTPVEDKRRRSPSINSINTTLDPKKSVPQYLQGLF